MKNESSNELTARYDYGMSKSGNASRNEKKCTTKEEMK